MNYFGWFGGNVVSSNFNSVTTGVVGVAPGAVCVG